MTLREWNGSNEALMRAFIDDENNLEFRLGVQGWLSTLVPSIAKHVQGGGSILSFSSMVALGWLAVMERYMEAVYDVLGRDSQAGSAVSQEKLGQKKFELCDAHRTDLLQILQAHPTIKSPDFIVPTTWLRKKSDMGSGMVISLFAAIEDSTVEE